MTRSFAALQHRDYRFLWASTVCVAMSMQMEGVVVAWFVLELTDSPALTGGIVSARLAMTILAAFTGAVADRVPRRMVLLATQGVLVLNALAMLALITADRLEVWHIFALSFLGGLCNVFAQPARSALMADSVAEGEVSNAVALNQAAMNVTQVIAPFVGGTVFKFLGPSGAYMAIAAVQAVGLLATAAIRRPRPLAPQDLGRPTVWGNMIDGLRYAKRDSLIMGALLMAAIANLTGFPFNMAVLPVFARNVLHTDSAGLGLMLSCIGIGSLAGSMVLAGIPNLRYAGRWMIAGMAGWHLAYLLVALSPSVPVAAVPLLAVGVMQSIAMVTIAAILLGRALPQYRGRVMGLRQLAVYTLVGGSPAAGAMAGAIGIPATAAALCGLGLTLILGLAWRVRGLASEHAARLPA